MPLPNEAIEPVVYLDGTQVTLPTNINTSSRFSFRFLACSQGIILSQGSDITIALEQPPSNETFYHTVLTVEGKNLQKTFIAPKYSLDSNVFINVDIKPNSTGLLITITPDSEQVKDTIKYIDKFVKGNLIMLNDQKLILGSSSFVGCIYNGIQVSVDAKKSLCPLDTWKPCNNKGIYIILRYSCMVIMHYIL